MPKEFILTLIMYCCVALGIVLCLTSIIASVALQSWIVFSIFAICGAGLIATACALEEHKQEISLKWEKSKRGLK